MLKSTEWLLETIGGIIMNLKKDENAKKLIWLDEKNAAEHLSLSVWTLRGWRRLGKIITKRGTETPPPYYRRGGKIFYRADELDDWLMQGAQ